MDTRGARRLPKNVKLRQSPPRNASFSVFGLFGGGDRDRRAQHQAGRCAITFY